MRFVNDTDSTLRSFELGRDIGAHEEFDWPGWDPEKHGVIPGCRPLDKPVRRQRARDSGDTNDDPDSNAGGDTANGQPATDDAAGASKENPR